MSATVRVRGMALAVFSTMSLTPAVAQQPAADVVASQHEGVVVWAKPADQLNQYGAAFVVGVKNDTAKPVDFSISAISAESSGKPLHVVTFEELLAGVNYLKVVAYGVLAGRPATRRSYETERYPQYSLKKLDEARVGWCGPKEEKRCGGAGWYVIAFPSGDTARAGEDRELQKLEKRLAEDAKVINDQVVGDAKIPAGVQAGGIVVLERPEKSGDIKLTVTVNGHQHVLTAPLPPAT